MVNLVIHAHSLDQSPHLFGRHSGRFLFSTSDVAPGVIAGCSVENIELKTTTMYVNVGKIHGIQDNDVFAIFKNELTVNGQNPLGYLEVKEVFEFKCEQEARNGRSYEFFGFKKGRKNRL